MNITNQPWWKNAVIYHVYVRSFADSNGDGLGDLQGLINRLDYLKGGESSLGVDALWLSPIYPSPDADFGYDVADYCNIDLRYGTLEIFDKLVEKAHERGIRIIMDLVFNHTSDQHPWFLESRSSRNNPKRDWYIWQDPAPGGRPPNNWQAVFGGRAWEFDPETEQYYLHLFVKQQPDLNWRNPEVAAALMDFVRFWLNRGVDGFRLDVFNLWFKHPDFPDNPPALGIRAFDRQKPLHIMDQPEMFPALNTFREILDAHGDTTSVGELFEPGVERAASYCGKDKLHMVFNFEFSKCPFSPARFREAIQRWEDALEEDQWPCYVLSNHDLNRHVTRYDRHPNDAVAKITAALLLTLRGTPFLYYGEELGLPDTKLTRSQIVDPPGLRFWPLYKGRDPARCPMPWNASANGGFTSGNPWLPLYSGYKERNAAVQQKDPHSVWSFYNQLLKLRRNSPALSSGSYHSLNNSSRKGMAYQRTAGDEKAVIALNFTRKQITLELNAILPQDGWDCSLSSLPAPSAVLQGTRISLGPYEAAVWLHKAS